MPTTRARRPKNGNAKPILHDAFKLRGYLEYVLRNAVTGEVVRRGRGRNTVSASGRSWALSKLHYSADQKVISWLAIGSSSSAPTSNESQLVAYTTIKIIGTTGLTTGSNTPCTATFAVSFASDQTFTGSNQIGEFALYNSSGTAGATMFNRLNTGAYINFATSNTLAITITVTN